MNKKKQKTEAILEIFKSDNELERSLPYAEGISAGFPSPASEYIELSLDLNKELIKHPAATFFGRVRGNSMQDAGIFDGDILVIDKSLMPYDGAKAVCYIDGEFTLKTLRKINNELWLMPANESYKPIKINENDDFIIWGIVTYVIHKML
jgi:DNA polymerase V